MLRSTLKLAGLFTLAGSVAVLAIDASRSFAAGRLAIARVGETAAALAPDRMAALNAALAHAHPLVARIVPMIERAPTALAFGLLGALALWLAREPPPKIGYSSR
jgi:hypothetical protein